MGMKTPAVRSLDARGKAAHPLNALVLYLVSALGIMIHAKITDTDAIGCLEGWIIALQTQAQAALALPMKALA